MNTKKKIVLVGVVLLIIFSALYMKSQSTYGQVKSSQVTENKSEEGLNDRTSEEIAMDKKIQKQREKNVKTFREEGIVGSFTRGSKQKFLGIEETNNAFYACVDYVRSHPEIYEDYDEEDNLVVGCEVDIRFQDFLFQIPPEEKKGIAKGYKDDEIYILEGRRKDGEWDTFILLKNPDTRKWSVEYVGNYYDYRDSIQK